MARRNLNEPDSAFTPNTDVSGHPIAENLIALAKELSYNYFTNSFGDEYNIEITTIRDIFKDVDDNLNYFKQRKGRVRNILIVGAGASHDVYKAIPTGNDLIDEVRQVYEAELKTIPFLKEKFEEQEAEILDITNQDKLYFENYLYLLSKLFVTQKELRDKIKDMTGYRHSVSLFNELVAHLLKHAFLDVVINFNFEETLDTAIKHEIGSENYHNIISDGSCVDLKQILVDGRLKMPIYIKPHGTFSHKSTLRFTNRHYFDLPNDIKKMLADLIRGQRGKKEIQHVNLIMVGFAAESIEFNRIINENLPPDSQIYQIDFRPCKDGLEFFKKRPFFKDFLSRAEKNGHTANDIYKPISTEHFNQNISPSDAKTYHISNASNNQITSTLGELFSVLWRKQNDFFKIPYRPRSIARHEIISYLFYLPQFGLSNLRSGKYELAERVSERKFIMENIETHPKYFRNRVLVELFILLNRNNGILDIAQILKGRAGSYYNKYVEAWNARPNVSREILTIQELLSQFSESAIKVTQNSPQNYIDLKSLLDTNEYSSGKNLFILQTEFNANDFESITAFSNKVSEITIKIVGSFADVPLPINSPITHDQYLAQVKTFSENMQSILKGWYNKRIKYKGESNEEELKLNRTVTLFYRLMTSGLISNFFKFNFVLNHSKVIYNGKKSWSAEILVNKERIMLSELFRLLSKSWSHHYFVIDPKPKNPVHHIWESFSKSKLMHTNLTRSVEFRDIFNKQWDIYLSITETGSLVNFMHYLPDDRAIEEMKSKMAKRHLIIICSYESIKQLYPNSQSEKDVLTLHKRHLRVEISDNDFIIPDENMTLMAIPFNHHNHHLSVFLQAMEPGDLHVNLKQTLTILEEGFNTESVPFENDLPKFSYIFHAVGSMYIYRSGFSNSIDPLYIGLAGKNETTSDKVHRDQMKLIDTFVTHIERAYRFEYFASNDKMNPWDKMPALMELQVEWRRTRAEISVKAFLTLIYKMIDKIQN